MTVETLPVPTPEAERPQRERTEALLLGIAAVFLLVNWTGLTLARGSVATADVLLLAGWGLSALAGRRLLNRHLPGHDPLLFPLTMFLTGWGLIAIDRLAPIFAERQTLWLLVSTAALLLTALTPNVLRWLRAYRYTLLVVGLVLLVSTILLGQNPSGQVGAPRLWLGFGTFYFQPSEALKIILVAFLASYLGEQYPSLRADGLDTHSSFLLSPRVFGPILLMWGLSVIILVWQEDLGTAILFFAVFLILLYIASGQLLILLGGALLIAVAAFAAYHAFAVVRLRVDIWLNPWPEATDRAYQIVQSLLAFGSGGVFGQGVGQGFPIVIPVVHSDFIFAAIAEEWGLLGVTSLIVVIATIVMRGFRVAVLQRGRPFNTLLAVGLSALIGVQSVLIMGGVLKLLPLTGVTLPFVSYGGSSLLVSFIMIGLLLRLSAGES